MHTELAQWLCTTNDMHNVCYVVAGSEAGEQPVDRIRTYRIQLLWCTDFFPLVYSCCCLTKL